MLKITTSLSVTLILAGHSGLEAQGVPNPPKPIQEAVQERTPPTPFPSSADLRSKIKIRLIRHGCLGCCAQYSVTVFGNGRILYEGEECVRVQGRAKANITNNAVDDLIRRVNDIDFFSLQPQKSQRCVTDTATASITVSEPGREKQIEDECVESDELLELEKAVDNAVEIQQWVFINAAELQKQIDLGWDITIHGQEYAHQAIEWDDPQVIRVLVKNGLPIETQNEDGETLLMQAVLRNRYKSAKALLELGANPKMRAFYGWAPSQNAGNRSVEMCKLFLAHGAGIDDQDGLGETMLMNAARSPGNLEIVKFLVSSGAALNLRNEDGETAMGLAKQMRKQFQGSMDLTSAPNFPSFLGDPQAARASDAATIHQYEEVIEYLKQHGGTD